MAFASSHHSATCNIMILVIIALCITSQHLSTAATDQEISDKWQLNWGPEESIIPLPIREDQIDQLMKDAELIQERVLADNLYGQIAPFKHFFDSCKTSAPMTPEDLIKCAASKPIEFEKHSLSSAGMANLFIKELTENIDYLDVGPHLYTISACEEVDDNDIDEYTQNEFPKVEACSIQDVAVAMKLTVIHDHNDDKNNNGGNDDNSSKNERYMVMVPMGYDDVKVNKGYLNGRRVFGLRFRTIYIEEYSPVKTYQYELIRRGGYMVFVVPNGNSNFKMRPYHPDGTSHVFYVKRPFRNHDLTRKYSLFDQNKYLYRHDKHKFRNAQLEVKFDKDPKVVLTFGPKLRSGQQMQCNFPLKLAYKPSGDDGDAIPVIRDEDTEIVSNKCTTCGDELENDPNFIYCETGKCLALVGIAETEKLMLYSEEEKANGGLHGILYGLQKIAKDTNFMDAFTGVDIKRALVELIMMNNQEKSKGRLHGILSGLQTISQDPNYKRAVEMMKTIPEASKQGIQKIKQSLNNRIIIYLIAGIIVGVLTRRI